MHTEKEEAEEEAATTDEHVEPKPNECPPVRYIGPACMKLKPVEPIKKPKLKMTAKPVGPPAPPDHPPPGMKVRGSLALVLEKEKVTGKGVLVPPPPGVASSSCIGTRGKVVPPPAKAALPKRDDRGGARENLKRVHEALQNGDINLAKEHAAKSMKY